VVGADGDWGKVFEAVSGSVSNQWEGMGNEGLVSNVVPGPKFSDAHTSRRQLPPTTERGTDKNNSDDERWAQSTTVNLCPAATASEHEASTRLKTAHTWPLQDDRPQVYHDQACTPSPRYVHNDT
jgi:hypothetical protein